MATNANMWSATHDSIQHATHAPTADHTCIKFWPLYRIKMQTRWITRACTAYITCKQGRSPVYQDQWTHLCNSQATWEHPPVSSVSNRSKALQKMGTLQRGTVHVGPPKKNINMTNLKIGLMCLQLATECRKHFWVWGSALKGVNNPQRCRACALQAQALETKNQGQFPFTISKSLIIWPPIIHLIEMLGRSPPQE